MTTKLAYETGNILAEAAIIIPRTDLATLVDFERVMIADFGGFTRTACFGGWRDPHGHVVLEPVFAYTIACRRNREAVARLYALAGQVRDRLAQEEVYLRLPTGEVLLVGADTLSPPYHGE